MLKYDTRYIFGQEKNSDYSDKLLEKLSRTPVLFSNGERQLLFVLSYD